jgi:signal transduction histidine kinase
LTLAGRAKAEAPRSFAVSYEPHVDRDGQRTVVIVVVDIMTRKRAEEALRASESRLRELAVQLEHRVAERPRELEHSHSRLREMATELNLTEQRERQRMATELHDHLQQILMGTFGIRQGRRSDEAGPQTTDHSSEG